MGNHICQRDDSHTMTAATQPRDDSTGRSNVALIGTTSQVHTTVAQSANELDVASPLFGIYKAPADPKPNAVNRTFKIMDR